MSCVLVLPVAVDSTEDMAEGVAVDAFTGYYAQSNVRKLALAGQRQ